MGESALIPSELLRQRQFVTCCVLVPLLATGFFVLLLYLPQYMQKLLGYSPLKAGVGLLPMMAVFGAVSFVAGTLYERLGAKLSTSLGAGSMTLGLLALSFVGTRHRLRPARARDGAVRDRRRTVLLVRDDGGGDGTRPGACEPRRRRPVHVPGRRRLDRARSDDGDLHYDHAGEGPQHGRSRTSSIRARSTPSTGSLPAPTTRTASWRSSRTRGAGLTSIARRRSPDGIQTVFHVTAALAAVAFVVAAVFIKGRPRLHAAAAAEPSVAAA